MVHETKERNRGLSIKGNEGSLSMYKCDNSFTYINDLHSLPIENLLFIVF